MLSVWPNQVDLTERQKNDNAGQRSGMRRSASRGGQSSLRKRLGAIEKFDNSEEGFTLRKNLTATDSLVWLLCPAYISPLPPERNIRRSRIWKFRAPVPRAAGQFATFMRRSSVSGMSKAKT